ncbi:MAG TPA: hypothetical protein VLT35_01520, partial [Methanocella sp.]|nr:hypothetical protein [Methanocella sp.]
VQGSRFYDIGYSHLTSLGNGRHLDRRSAARAVGAFFVALVCLATYWMVPGAVRDMAAGAQADPGIWASIVSKVNGLGNVTAAICVALCAGFLVLGTFYFAQFLLSLRQGIVMETPEGTYVFYVAGRDRAGAVEFVKRARAAEEEKVRAQLLISEMLKRSM